MNQPDELSLHSLSLLRLTAKHRSFTEAAAEAGISQSALSRQVQNLEARIGLPLLERTTRKVGLTEAGAILLRETAAVPNLLSGALRRVREECLNAPRKIRVGLSPELALAHIPGLFHQARKTSGIIISQMLEDDLTDKLIANELDLGILSAPKPIPQSLEALRKIPDRFSLIAPEKAEISDDLPTWSEHQNWLLPKSNTKSRELIEKWSKRQRWKITPHMELENFDLMVQLVALGMGCAFVPQRSLSSFPRKHQIQSIKLPQKLTRTLGLLRPRFSHVPEHVEEFIEGILFS